MEFVETPTFTRLVLKLMADDDYAAMQAALARRPDLGKIIPGSGGIRTDVFYPPSTPVEAPWVVNPRGFRAYVRNDIFFQAIPLVVVTADISPFSFNAMQLMVPCGGSTATWYAQANVSSSTPGNAFRISAIFFFGGASVMDSQLVCPLRSRISRFHMRHASRERSVIKSSSW